MAKILVVQNTFGTYVNGTIEALRPGFEAATRYFKVCHFTNWSCHLFQILRIIFLKRASLLWNLVNHSPKA
jgi:hypothetical protein